MRRAARTDRNHAEIVAALRTMGCSVIDLSRVGDGCPDLLVGLLGRNVLLEIKAEKGLVRANQAALLAGWRGEAYLVRSVDDAIRAIFQK